MIIDVHAHCFPDQLAPKALAILGEKAGIPPMLDGTVGQLEAAMGKAGIDLSVLLPIATKPEQTVGVNQWAIEAQNNKLISFGTIHPAYANWREEIKRLAESGIKGVKFHPNYQDFSVDDPKLFPIYEELFSAGLMALFHAGLDLWYTEPNRCHPRQLGRLLTLFPGGTVITAHMGGFRCWDEVETNLIGRELYFDSAYSFAELGAEKMRRLIKSHGAEKILFGTDAPWTDPKVEIAQIRSLDLTEEEINKILGENARRLLRF